jgi:hypothetical protein
MKGAVRKQVLTVTNQVGSSRCFPTQCSYSKERKECEKGRKKERTLLVHSFIHSLIHPFPRECHSLDRVVDTRVLADLIWAYSARKGISWVLEDDVLFQSLVCGFGGTQTAYPWKGVEGFALSGFAAAKANEVATIGCGPGIASGAYTGPEAKDATDKHAQRAWQSLDTGRRALHLDLCVYAGSAASCG